MVTFTKEILNGKLHLCSKSWRLEITFSVQKCGMKRGNQPATFTADLISLTGKILDRKLHFLRIVIMSPIDFDISENYVKNVMAILKEIIFMTHSRFAFTVQTIFLPADI